MASLPRTSLVSVAPGSSRVWVVVWVVLLVTVRSSRCSGVRCPACRRQTTSSARGRRRGVLGQDGVDLTDGLLQALRGAESEDLLHRLGAGEAALDRHPRPSAADLLDCD